MGLEESNSGIEKAIERLNKDPYLLAAVSAIPFVGSSVAQVITGIGQRIVQDRYEKFLQLLSEHISVLDERTVKKDYFETPEGFDLFIQALDESRKTRSEEKRDLIARVLAGAVSTYQEQGEYSPEEYVNIVASLTVKELEVARTIYGLQRNISPKDLDSHNRVEMWRLQKESIREKHEIDADELPFILNRISYTGLLDVVNITYPGVTSSTYWVSPSFNKLVRFLRIEE